jgi:hypothetical protein
MKSISLVLILTFAIVGCGTTGKRPQDPFAYGAYGTLASSLAARDMAMKFVGNLRAAKQVSDEKWNEINALDNKFLEKYYLAAKAMSDYKKGLATQAIVALAQSEMEGALKALKEYYANQIPADNKPLIK